MQPVSLILPVLPSPKPRVPHERPLRLLLRVAALARLRSPNQRYGSDAMNSRYQLVYTRRQLILDAIQLVTMGVMFGILFVWGWV